MGRRSQIGALAGALLIVAASCACVYALAIRSARDRATLLEAHAAAGRTAMDFAVARAWIETAYLAQPAAAPPQLSEALQKVAAGESAFRRAAAAYNRIEPDAAAVAGAAAIGRCLDTAARVQRHVAGGSLERAVLESARGEFAEAERELRALESAVAEDFTALGLRTLRRVLGLSTLSALIMLAIAAAAIHSRGETRSHLAALTAAVAERSVVEAARQESEARLTQIFESVNDGIFLVDPQSWEIVEANAPGARMLGYAANAMTGHKVAEFIPEERPWFEQFAGEVASKGYSYSSDVQGHRRDGTQFPAEISASNLIAGERRLIIAVVRDVTERQRSHEARERLERQTAQGRRLESLGALAGGIAEDFERLLTRILGHLDAASSARAHPETAEANLRHARATALRAAELVGYLKDYAGTNVRRDVPLDLNEVAADAAAWCREAMPLECGLDLELAERLPCVMGDPAQLRQVMASLLANAAEALERRPGRIRLKTSAVLLEAAAAAAQAQGALAPRPHVRIEVSDDGPGMEPEVAERIFDPFFSTKFSQRGLGLAAALGIVRNHHGAIAADTAPGHGTVVRIDLPAVPGQRPQPAALDLAAEATVLVADDDADTLRRARQQLEQAGFAVLTARDGLEALALFRQAAGAVDLALLDIAMPNMDGLETLRALRAMNPHLPVLLGIGASAHMPAEQMPGLHADGFVQKPYDAGTLAHLVREACQVRR